jgi:phospholipid/cholesterol/gamma-HCH transport system permease protein
MQIFFLTLGDFVLYSLKACKYALTTFRFDLIVHQILFIGNKSVGLIFLTSIFTGMVLCFQSYEGLKIINGYLLVGPLVALSLAKEIGPVFTSIILAGRCCSAITAEISSMKVTDQIDALEVMGISPIYYLSVPRILALMLCLPCLSLIFIFIANIGSYFIGTQLLGISSEVFFLKLRNFVFYENIVECLIKSVCFGFLLGLISTYQGLKSSGGAEGVGIATNKSVVWSMSTIFIFDFFLTTLLIQTLYA